MVLTSCQQSNITLYVTLITLRLSPATGLSFPLNRQEKRRPGALTGGGFPGSFSGRFDSGEKAWASYG